MSPFELGAAAITFGFSFFGFFCFAIPALFTFGHRAVLRTEVSLTSH
jgi:hypothetical protein